MSNYHRESDTNKKNQQLKLDQHWLLWAAANKSLVRLGVAKIRQVWDNILSKLRPGGFEGRRFRKLSRWENLSHSSVHNFLGGSKKVGIFASRKRTIDTLTMQYSDSAHRITPFHAILQFSNIFCVPKKIDICASWGRQNSASMR